MSVVDARVAFCLAVIDLMPGVYAWGGEEWEEGGHDCSGLVSAALLRVSRHWPALYDGQRRTAAGLRQHFLDRGCSQIQAPTGLEPGALAFLSVPGHAVHHVRVHLFTSPGLRTASGGMLAVGPIAIEAGGGGSKTTSPRVALMTAATLRPVATDRPGGGEWCAVDPFEVLEP